MLEVTLLIFFLALLYQVWRSRTRAPPGPPRIPFMGSLPFISTLKGLTSWALDISVTSHKLTSVGLGTKIINVVNDYELAKELFSKDEFSGRVWPEFWYKHKGFEGKPYGITMTHGRHWSTQKRFSLKALKDLGYGKKKLEDIINMEVEEFLDNIKFQEDEDGDFLLSDNFNVSIINVLWQLVAGERFTVEDTEAMEVLATVNRFFELFFYMELFPQKVMEIFPNATHYGEMANIVDTKKSYFLKKINEHDLTRDPQHPRDFVDIYLNEMKSSKDLTKYDLVCIMDDFLMAGTETTATFLKWLILFLTLHQDVQDKCRAEIDAILCSSNCCVADKSRLPYVQATMAEVLRLGCLTAFGALKCTTIETTVEGYTFPSGSLFVANLEYIMVDPDNFSEPQLFKPERFVDQNGIFTKNDKFVPFGIGKRACMGEQLAQQEMFLFTVNLLQRMKFLPPKSHSPPDPANYTSNLTKIPQNFFVRFVYL